MSSEMSELNLISIFNSLSEIPLSVTDKKEAFRKITELGKQAMRSHACSLVFFDLKNKCLTQEACAGFDQEFETYMNGDNKRNRERGRSIDYDLIAKIEGGPRYGLQEEGNGVANPEIARKYNLKSVLSSPLKVVDGRLVGYFNHFSSTSEPFTEYEKSLLKIFAHQVAVVLDRFEYQRTLERSLSIFSSLSQSLLTVSEGKFLDQVSKSACELLDVPTCIVWKFDRGARKLRIAATVGEVDEQYREVTLDPNHQVHIKSRKVGYLPDVRRASKDYYQDQRLAERRGWVSLLTAPMWVENRLIGMLDVYTKETRDFQPWERQFFNTFADSTAVCIQKAELLKEAEENLMARKKLEKLNAIIEEVSAATSMKNLLDLILKRSLELVGASRGWVAMFDAKTGQLNIVSHWGKPPEARPLRFGKGITGLAFKTESPIRADNVRDSKWEQSYEVYWPDTQSEMAVPILINNAEVRVGPAIHQISKPIGVINIESPEPNAFSKADEDVLLSLARHTATIIEKIEFDIKVTKLRNIEHEIAGNQDWDETIRIIVDGIRETLGFEYINISLVEPELKRVKTEYIVGIPERDVAEFKRLAVHSLASTDIQASIVNSGAIEVPDSNDKRFDTQIYKRFRHEQLIRVFMPMIVSSEDRVIGTVEAGYQKGYRKHIYERDVQILQGFVNSAVRSLGRRRRGLLEKINHEFTAPVVGIRNNASYLQRHRTFERRLFRMKFNDILTDCELLLLKVGELGHILGGTSPVSRRERTLVYRDIIIKTINQLKPLVAERGFEISRIRYDAAVRRIKIYVDKAKLNSVVYNLLINSIKYAKDDLREFNIRILLDIRKDSFVIKFKDWGIGIDRKYCEKVFDDGFRAPEAIDRYVTGSGLGLTIARKTMREIGGDLILANLSGPTEFHLILPKSLREVPDDSTR
jgi:signal transduction histidine kinase/GAF domain-containing protein